MSIDTRVDTQVWAPNPDKPGYLQLVRTKTVREVYDEIVATLEKDEWGYIRTPGAEEYFQIAVNEDANAEWPQGQIVVFPVTGGSEGHYVHVEVLNTGGYVASSDVQEKGRVLLILGKTFEGWDAAWDFAKRLAQTLDV